jgi:PAS domain S-box-containing protein
MVLDAARVRTALSNGEFMPFFQPVVEMRSRRLVGFEVLARWCDPDGGVILPDAFVPGAERDGWLSELTGQLLYQAFTDIKCAPEHLLLAFNISAYQLHDRHLPKQIRNAAKAAGFALDRLSLELTESALVEDFERAREVAGDLKSMGCRLALDDFGIGFSSLRTLQDLPFDILKVDRSFVQSMTMSKESRKIVAAVVGLGQSLGITTVAEGIATEEQDAMLLWLGCDYGQGWLFGEAVPAKALPETMAALQERKMQRPAGGMPSRHSVSEFDRAPAMRLAQLRAVYDGAPVGLAFLDRDLRYVTLNRRLADMNGAAVEEHLGRTVKEMIPEIYPLVEPFIRRALDGESIPGVEIERPASGPNGGKTLLLSYEPARDEAGEVVGVSVALADVTAMRAAEKSCREVEEHFRSLLDLNPQIPWIIDSEGRALDVSERWMAATGREVDSWRGFGWLDSLHPDDVAHTREVLSQSLQSGEPIDVKYRVRPAGGEWTWKRARGWPRRDAQGGIPYWYGILEESEADT